MSETNDWLAPELREQAALKDFKDPNALAKSYLETKSLVGASLRPPGPDASVEARVEFARKLQGVMPDLVLVPEDETLRAAVEDTIWTKLGRPTDEAGYEAKVEDVEIDLAVMRAEAKAEGLTKAQFAKRLEKRAGEARAAKTSRAEAEAALRKEWAGAYEEKVLQAKAAALKLGVPESALASIPPAQLKVWANVAKSIGGEARNVGDQPANGTGALTREEMGLRVAEMRARKEYLDGSISPLVTAHLRRQVMEMEKLLDS